MAKHLFRKDNWDVITSAVAILLIEPALILVGLTCNDSGFACLGIAYLAFFALAAVAVVTFFIAVYRSYKGLGYMRLLWIAGALVIFAIIFIIIVMMGGL